MPIFKLSDNFQRLALEVMKVPISVLGDCPQCGSKNYRDGVCGDCGFISPEIMEAIQAWQQSQGMEPVTSSRATFADAFPQLQEMPSNARIPYGLDAKKLKVCLTCKKKTFVTNDVAAEMGQDSLTGVKGGCLSCGREGDPDSRLGDPRRQTGNPLERRRVFRRRDNGTGSTTTFIKDQKGLKKFKASQEKVNPDIFNNVNTIRNSPIVRGQEALQAAADLKTQQRLTNPDDSAESSEDND
jgi:ribosomal protein L32